MRYGKRKINAAPGDTPRTFIKIEEYWDDARDLFPENPNTFTNQHT